MTIRPPAPSDEEREELGRMARSHTLGAGRVRRARIVLHAVEGLGTPEIGARLGRCGATGRHGLKRFKPRGLDGLEEDGGTGRPPTYAAGQRRGAIDTAVTRPAGHG